MSITTLSETIAKAILATVEKDRCCNLGNITETVFRELAVAEAREREPKPQPEGDDAAIVKAAADLMEVMACQMVFRDQPPVFRDAIYKLRDLLFGKVWK